MTLPRRILGWIGRIALALVALLAVSIVIVALLLGTERGTGLLLDTVRGQLDGGEATHARWQHQRGTLFSGLELTDVDVMPAAGTRVQAERVFLDLGGRDLLALRLRVAALEGSRIEIDLPAGDPTPPEPAEPLYIEAIDAPALPRIPLEIVIDRVEIQRLALRIDAAPVFDAERLFATAAVTRNGVDIRVIELDSDLANARMTARIGADPGLPFELQLQADAPAPVELGQYLPSHSGDRVQLEARIEGQLSAALELQMRAYVSDTTLATPRLRAASTRADTTNMTPELEPESAVEPQSDPIPRGAAETQHEGAQDNAELVSVQLQIHELLHAPRWDLTVAWPALQIQLPEADIAADAPAESSASTEVDAEPPLRLERADLDAGQLTSRGQARFHPAGTRDAASSPDAQARTPVADLDAHIAFDVHARLALEAASPQHDAPAPIPLHARLRASGTLDRFALDPLIFESGDGRIEATAEAVARDGGWDWMLEAAADALDPAALGLPIDAALERLRLAGSGRYALPAAATARATSASSDTDASTAPDHSPAPPPAWATLLDALQADVELETLEARAGEWNARASGELRARPGEAIEIDLLAGTADIGEARLSGRLLAPRGGSDAEAVLQLVADDLDLGPFTPADFPTRVERLALAIDARLPSDGGLPSARLSIDDSAVRVRGERIGLQALARLEDTPSATPGEASASGSRGVLDHLRIALPRDGQIELTGQADLDAPIPWSFDLSGRAIDLRWLLPELDLDLQALRLSGEGHVGDDDTPLAADLRIAELRGRFRGEPLESSGRVRIDGEIIDIEGLDAVLAENRVSLRGQVAERLNLDLRVEAARLDAILPELAGNVQLSAEVRGTREAPSLQASGRVSDLLAPGIRLPVATLEARLGTRPQDRFELALVAERLEVGEQTVPEIRLVTDGTAAAHTIRFNVAGPDDLSLALGADGGLDIEAQRWRGLLERLDFSQPLAGDWRLGQPAALDLSAERQRVETLCLLRDPAALCVEADRHADGRLDARASLQRFALALLAPLLPDGSDIEGQLDFTAEATIDAAGRMRADAELLGAPGRVRFLDGFDQRQTIPFGALEARASVRDEVIETRLGWDILDNGRIAADLRMAPEGGVSIVRGDVSLDVESLAMFDAFSADVEGLDGAIDGRFRLDGPLNAPLAEGALVISKLAATIPEAGIELRVPELRVDVEDAQNARVRGRLESGAGHLTLDGLVALASGQPDVTLAIAGERFTAVGRPDIEAEISPDLQLAYNPDSGARLRGSLTIPRARIFPPDLPPGSVSVSSDEIILGDEPRPDGSGLPIDARIRVILGDDVRFEGFGLEARIAGNVEVIEQSGRDLQIFGEIRIPEGSYKAYGQDLRVQRGTVLFQGPPDTPDLDILAVRNVRQYDVVVGIEVGGTPQELRSRVTSTPAMDDTEAMSYLITGRPLSGATPSEGNLIAGAAAAFGLEQASEVTGKIGAELGLDEFGISGEDGLDQAAFTIGKYLTPSLLLRYSTGLFNNSSLVLLRYQLTRSLAVETSTGTTGQGIEFLYRIER